MNSYIEMYKIRTITYYEIELSTYHDEIVGRIQFSNNGVLEKSALYSTGELNNIIHLWKMGELMGSFAIGTQLADNATYVLFQRG